MQLPYPGIAGTMESGDIYIEIVPQDGEKIDISLKSSVNGQFGAKIRGVIETVAAECGLKGVAINAVDKGALDCTIRARVTAAAMRAQGRADYTWN